MYDPARDIFTAGEDPDDTNEQAERKVPKADYNYNGRNATDHAIISDPEEHSSSAELKKPISVSLLTPYYLSLHY
jgi:hypothetical protein